MHISVIWPHLILVHSKKGKSTSFLSFDPFDKSNPYMKFGKFGVINDL